MRSFSETIYRITHRKQIREAETARRFAVAFARSAIHEDLKGENKNPLLVDIYHRGMDRAVEVIRQNSPRGSL